MDLTITKIMHNLNYLLNKAGHRIVILSTSLKVYVDALTISLQINKKAILQIVYRN